MEWFAESPDVGGDGLDEGAVSLSRLLSSSSDSGTSVSVAQLQEEVLQEEVVDMSKNWRGRKAHAHEGRICSSVTVNCWASCLDEMGRLSEMVRVVEKKCYGVYLPVVIAGSCRVIFVLEPPSPLASQ
jgi:hypothetical protein